MNMGDGRFFAESGFGWIRMFSLVETSILAAGFEWILPEPVGHRRSLAVKSDSRDWGVRANSGAS